MKKTKTNYTKKKGKDASSLIQASPAREPHTSGSSEVSVDHSSRKTNPRVEPRIDVDDAEVEVEETNGVDGVTLSCPLSLLS